MIIFTHHAVEKFRVLKRHGFVVSRAQVLDAVRKPDRVDYSRLPLIIAQGQIDRTHVLRVVYRVDGDNIKIITFYPGRTKQYE